MNLEDQIRENLQVKGQRISPPPRLRMAIMNTLPEKHKRWKKRLITVILLLMFFVPTTTIAYQSYAADSLYGSFDNLKRHISTATMKGYFLLDAKFSQAKGELDKEEYDEFKELLKKITQAKLTYADSYGNIDYTTLPPEKALEMRETFFQIQPYFDELNNQVSSKDVLSGEEYNRYIDALMLYETIVSQSGVDPSSGVKVEDILPEFQRTFLDISSYLEYVNEKQVNLKAQ
ncbi:DUF3600 domain-containing protein [Rossellomorea aquimaris]|uniref:DUF3600 domain-containing protein n=1 Tax=Rossellomorea TaxID=2837508 RepID=UPI001CD48AB9|nr:DUF3600 domain-containing protein [Rossellomorea aquimaris]MCA1060680.1 DUF3600 domain-containing protein [Rossellomorea aquimaris]